MSKQYKVRKGQTVRYENPTGVVTYRRVARVTSQSAITIDSPKGAASISAVPKSSATTPAIPAGVKPARYSWTNA
jgi:hypothetical protein